MSRGQTIGKANPSARDSDSAFKALVRAISGRVRSCQCFDANVGVCQTRECIGKRNGYRVRIGDGGARIAIEIHGFETTFWFSLGARNRIFFFERQPSFRLSKPLASVRAFAPSDCNRDAVRGWLAERENLSMLQGLNCSRSQPLYVVRNLLELITSPDRAHPDQIDTLVTLAERLPRPDRSIGRGTVVVDGMDFDPKKLPKSLRPLATYVVRWAVGDDAERDHQISGAKPREIERLLRVATPLLESIDQYLDSFGSNPLTDEAVLIGRLAEAVAELRLRKK